MYESSPTETNQKKDEKEQIMKKIRQLENQQKILLNRQSDMERRARTRRLIEHGAILESVFPTLAALPGEEVKAFLLALSRLPEAAELLKNTVKNEATAYPQDSKGALMHLVGASSIFFVSPQAAKLIHSAAPPLPTKS